MQFLPSLRTRSRILAPLIFLPFALEFQPLFPYFRSAAGKVLALQPYATAASYALPSPFLDGAMASLRCYPRTHGGSS